MEQKIRAIMIIEVMGRPAEHLLEMIKIHVGQIKTMKDIKYISESFSEPKKIEAEQEFYTCFAEVEIETKGFQKLMDLIFDFMPSSIEILEPSNIDFSLSDATSFLNTLAGRLHKYDEIAKIAQIQTQQLAQRLQQAQQALMEKDKNIKKPSKKKKTHSNKQKKKTKK